jgi:hypothetical protein
VERWREHAANRSNAEGGWFAHEVASRHERAPVLEAFGTFAAAAAQEAAPLSWAGCRHTMPHSSYSLRRQLRALRIMAGVVAGLRCLRRRTNRCLPRVLLFDVLGESRCRNVCPFHTHR